MIHVNPDTQLRFFDVKSDFCVDHKNVDINNYTNK
jgi:hypothetical protein